MKKTRKTIAVLLSALMLMSVVSVGFVMPVAAQGNADAYSVTYDPNGGAGEAATQAMLDRQAVQTDANTYTRTGYRYTGWNTKADGSGVSYADGATVTNPAVSYPARYIRVYTAGNTSNSSNHLIELQAIDTQGRNVALYKTGSRVTDNDFGEEAWIAYGDYYQVDLGARYDIKTVNMWRYWVDRRSYHNTVVALSENGTFAEGDRLVLFNADYTNRFGFGNGIDMEYPESAKGISFSVSDVRRANTYEARYIRLYSAGNTYNSDNHLVELQVFDSQGRNVALNRSGNVGTDGTVNTTYWAGYGTYYQVDFGDVYDITSIGLWRYWADNRYYYDTVVVLSKNGTFAEGDRFVVYNADDINRFGFGCGADKDYLETARGKALYVEHEAKTLPTFDARYLRVYAAGNSANGDNHLVELQAMANGANVAYGRSGTAITDGVIDTNGWVAFGGYYQVDFGAVYPVNSVRYWNYWADARYYNNLVVVLSKNGTFAGDDLCVLWNADSTNMFGFGAGTDPIFTETSAGKTFWVSESPAGLTASAKARFVRVYNGGSYANDADGYAYHAHMAEIQVFAGGAENIAYGKTGTVVTDGNRTDAYPNYYSYGWGHSYPNNYLEVDLGAVYDVTGVKLWQYYSDNRSYHNNVIVLSENGTFAGNDYTVIFNTDYCNMHGFGKGYDNEYVETLAGRLFPVKNVNAASTRTKTLYAQWIPNNYTINFDKNGTGVEGSTAPIAATYDVSVPLTSNGFSRFGYTFNGWATDPDGAVVYTNGQTVSNLTAEHNGTVTLYAVWTADPYTMEFDVNGGDAIAPIDYTVESTDTIPEPNRDGYDFVKWTATAAEKSWTIGETYAVGTPLGGKIGNVILQASWSVRYDTPYTVNHYYMNADGSYPDAPVSQTLMGETDTTAEAAGLIMETAHYTLDAAASDSAVTILGDGSAALNLYYKRNTNTVLFKNAAGETVQTDTLYYGAVPAYTGTVPTLAGTDANTYTFLGWTANAAAEPGSDAAYYAAGNLPPVTADVTYYPYFGAAVNSYDITFTVEGVDTTLSFPYGSTPAYNGIPTKAADAANTYAFSGWSPAITAVTGEAAYVAQFTATPISYLVRATAGAGSTITDVTGIYEYNDTVDFTVTVAEGYTGTSVVSVNGTQVDAAAANGNAYEYSVTVTGNTEITVADLNKQTFTITFNVDGTETEKTVAYGDTPAYGSVPAKAATAQYIYAFTGWDPEIVPATADAEYTAQFSETLRSYDISFVTPTGTTTISVPYGDTPAPGFTPAKAADAENTYEFAGWSTSADGEVAALAAVDGAATYYAIFTATPIPATQYLVTATAGVGATISDVTGNYAEGTTVSFDVTIAEGYDPTSLAVSVNGTQIDNPAPVSGVYSYTVEVTGATAITVADLDKNVYTVSFQNYDGTELYSTTVSHGDDVEYVGQTPMKPADENVYTFTGWSASTNNVTGDLTVTAQYSSEPLVVHTHDFSINCYDADYHWMGCACGAVDGEKEAHSFATAHNATAHWEECDCGYRKNSEAHTFADANDGAYHWEECACGEIRNKEAHNFTTTDFDATGHWQVCADCGALSTTEAHVLTLTYNATQHYLACDCGYTEGAEDHTLVTQHDETGHWQSCGCGYATATEAHSFDTETDAGAATCSTLAYSVKACACGETQHTESGSLDPDAHTGPYKVVGARAATTTAEGYTGDTICLACGGTAEAGHYTDMLSDTHTHSYDTQIETGEATCVAPAYVIKQCECGATEKIESGEVNPDAHAGPERLVGYKAATETEDGYSGDKYCLACGNLIEAGVVVNHTGADHVHSFDTVTESGAATCVAPAYEIKVCACGETKRFDGDALDPDNHVHTILVGARAATATADGYTGDTVCTACGNTTATGSVIPKTDPGHTHSYDTEVESAPATCVAKAYTVYKCSCGDTKKVETGEVNAANHAGEIKLMGYHAATETADGYTGDKYCLACGNLVEAGQVIPHTGSTTPENPTQPDDPGNNGGSNTDTRIPFLEWLRNFIKKLLALFKIGGGEGSIC